MSEFYALPLKISFFLFILQNQTLPEVTWIHLDSDLKAFVVFKKAIRKLQQAA